MAVACVVVFGFACSFFSALFFWVSSVAPYVASFCFTLGAVVLSLFLILALFSFRVFSFLDSCFILFSCFSSFYISLSVFTLRHPAHLVYVPVLCPRAILSLLL